VYWIQIWNCHVILGSVRSYVDRFLGDILVYTFIYFRLGISLLM
jgi:hypothetical protein